MNRLKLFLAVTVGLLGLLILGVYIITSRKDIPITELVKNRPQTQQNEGGLLTSDNPYSIDYLRKQDYPGSDIVIEQTLTPGSNYNKYITSYKSEGLKIYALMTIPTGEKPKDGWPVIIFNHGYISPTQYRTAERYEAYIDAFARNGYIVFKSDYRGHGNSEGIAGGHFSPGYTIDVLNALSSLKKYKDTNPEQIGMWGHSMGGGITLNTTVISKEIKAASIWAGTVGSINDEFSNWGRRAGHTHPSGSTGSGGGRQSLAEQFGTPEQNPQFWRSIDPLNYLQDINVPVEIQHGLSDEEVNPEVSANLNAKLKALGKTVEYYTYPGDNHNISNNFNTAIQRSVDFFDKYLKNE